MRFSWGWQKVVTYILEQIYSGNSNSFRQRFNFLIEFLEFVGQNRLENSLNLLVSRESEIQYCEFS